MMRFILAVTAVSVAISAQAGADSLERFVREHDSAAIVRAAEEAISRASQSKIVVWTSPLKELAPKRIYDDRVNIVVVVKESVLEETGLYIVRSISSYLPTSDSEWIFTPVKDGVYTYARKKKQA
jgi:hypothetical protein